MEYGVVTNTFKVKKGRWSARIESECYIDSSDLQTSEKVSEWLGHSLERFNRVAYDYYNQTGGDRG